MSWHVTTVLRIACDGSPARPNSNLGAVPSVRPGVNFSCADYDAMNGLRAVSAAEYEALFDMNTEMTFHEGVIPDPTHVLKAHHHTMQRWASARQPAARSVPSCAQSPPR